MVDCQVCDRSHAPSHPHIANIEGDGPIDLVRLVAFDADTLTAYETLLS